MLVRGEPRGLMGWEPSKAQASELLSGIFDSVSCCLRNEVSGTFEAHVVLGRAGCKACAPSAKQKGVTPAKSWGRVYTKNLSGSWNPGLHIPVHLSASSVLLYFKCEVHHSCWRCTEVP